MSHKFNKHKICLNYKFQKQYNFIIILMSDDGQDKNTCSMVGLLGILIQVGLGGLSFSILILKRYFQDPKRVWKIWAFDASKQMISQLIAHFINLTISLALTYDQKNSDQCLWYFVTNIFDNTMGVLICIILLKLIENNLRKRRRFQLISGNYYSKIDPLSLINQSSKMKQQKDLSIKQNQSDPNFRIAQNKDHKSCQISKQDTRIQAFNVQNNHPSKNQREQKADQTQSDEANFIFIIDYKAWVIQLAIWNGIVIIGKCALFGLQYGLEKQLQDFSMFILGWIEDYPVLELFLVMAFVPVIMNALAYWVQDNFLMKRQKQAEQKNLIEENLNENSRMQEEILNHQLPLIKQKLNTVNQKTLPRNQSDFDKNSNRFQFHDDYDAKDEQNPAQKFQNFDKFGKFAH